MPLIYHPEADSYLLAKVLKKWLLKLVKKNPELQFLEIGAGSGIQLKTALEAGVKKKNIFSCDLNLKAIQHCKKLGFKCIKSNLFKCINGRYDVIIFNPPYLPYDKKEPRASRVATTGGETGSETINEFLKQAKPHLKKKGVIFLLTSSLSKKVNFLNYKKKKVAKEKFFFEELYVWRLKI